MKVTKSNNLKHIKNIQEGYLKNLSDNDKLIVGFDNIKDKLDTLKFKKSLIDKLNYLCFSKIPKSKYDKINKFNESVYIKIRRFTQNLLDKENDKDTLISLYYLKNDSNLENIILCAFTDYGINLKSNVLVEQEYQSFNIPNIIYKIIKQNEITSDTRIILDEISKTLNKRLTNRKDSIAKSLVNNKIPFIIEKDKIIPFSKRLKWIENFLDIENKKIDLDKIKILEEKYKFSELEKMLNSEILQDKNFNEQNDIFLSVQIKQIISKVHEKNNLNFNENTEDDLRFYINEVRTYIEHYFPIKNNKRNNKIRKDKKYNKEYFNYYLNTNTIKQIIEKQIVNKLTNMLIQEGKVIYYTNLSAKIELNTAYFEDIKIEEAMRKQLIEGTVFANSKLRFFLTCDSKDFDVIGTDNKYLSVVNETVESDNNLIRRLQHYFTLGESISNDDLRKILNSSFCSISNIRHRIYHYRAKDNKLNELLNMNEYESKKQIKFDESIVNGLLEVDLGQFKNKFMDKITSMNLNLYYKESTLEDIFHICKFSLKPLIIVGVPSFKNVFKRGINLQKNQYSNNCDWFKKDIYEEATMNAYKNMLQLIYKYMFIPSLSSNDNILLDCIKKVKKYNMKINQHQEIKYAYKEIPLYERTKYDNVKDYFNDIMSKLVIKENEKDDKQKKGEIENKYQRFIQEVYTFAFIEYLEGHFGFLKSYILNPKLDEQSDISDVVKFKQIFKSKISVSLVGNYPLMIYMFFKILDNRQLSKIKNEIIKYLACNKKRSVYNLEMYEKLIELIEFIKIVRPVEIIDRSDFGYFEHFIDDIEKYRQGENKCIIYSSMEEIIKSEVLYIYKDKFKDYKITNENIEKYKKFTDKSNGISEIEKLQKEYKELHEKLVVNQSIDASDLEEYKRYIDKINEYNKLKNKVTFTNLKNIYDIHMEVVSRLVGFINDFERDLMFVMLALKKYNMINGINEDAIFKVFEGQIIGKLEKLDNYDVNLKNILSQLFYLNENGYKNFNVRNTVMHLDDLKNDRKIIDTINETRTIMSYDRKRKNAVMKSIIDILEKYGINMQFVEENKNFKLEEIHAKKIQHLKKKIKIEKNRNKEENKYDFLKIDKYDEEFIELVQILFK